MPLPDTPNGRIAGHLSQRLDAVREQKRPTTSPRGGKRGFGPGVAPPTTITSKGVGNCIALGWKMDRTQSNFRAIPR